MKATSISKNFERKVSSFTTESLVLLVVSILAFLLLYACSRDSDSTLSRIKNTGQICFAMEGTYPPFNFFNSKNELVGFDVDVAKEIAARLDVKAKLVRTKWSEMIPKLNAGEFDCILASMAITEERSKYVAFSEPYYHSGAQLLVRSDAAFQHPTDLKGKTIGVVADTTYEADARQLGADPILYYKDDYECLHELHLGVLDGVITDTVFGAYLKNIGKFDTKRLGYPLRKEKIALAFRKQDDAFIRKINKILKSMHKDGTLNSFISKVAQGGYNGGHFVSSEKP